MIAVATSAAPPVRLQLGTDCIARVEGASSLRSGANSSSGVRWPCPLTMTSAEIPSGPGHRRSS
jgi:hypothetical protein